MAKQKNAIVLQEMALRCEEFFLMFQLTLSPAHFCDNCTFLWPHKVFLSFHFYVCVCGGGGEALNICFEYFHKMSANVPTTKWKKRERKRKTFSHAKNCSHTHTKRESNNGYVLSATVSPITSVSTSRNKLLSLSGQNLGPWGPWQHTWMQKITWPNQRSKTRHTLASLPLSGGWKGGVAGGRRRRRCGEVVHLLLHPPQQLRVELARQVSFHQRQG